ncbi:predicted protein [Ostreococcus lucimarinus CCE9901]|uniref:Uncharacterized protein n=1 Tax=Ostreococcus lucimarinus (strain CCE9901) TaxID=436017 RepID=A4S9B1_OSTLU|nr:predicted protein [Ostreococcus lucimarinus CCE9901]ABP00326.1 predicted protein [Ostreococcus lucimarinus CCE9901]|eukprot:XP_001422032.1 predicted protein [Ostreococcus lucimarinus CCE9901]
MRAKASRTARAEWARTRAGGTRRAIGEGEGEGAATTAANDDAEEDDAEGEARDFDSQALPENYCIIEGRNSVVDFADMQAGEIAQNIESRRQRLFLLMEELRRLRVQQRVKTIGLDDDEVKETREFESVIPGFPVLTEDSVKDYRIYWGAAVGFLLLFGGLIAPMAEVKLGLGGTSYAEFIDSVHLPAQLAQVDPIVASFTGGAVGAISAFFVIEIQNVKEQRKKICMYCKGSGYLQCAECSTSNRPGRLIDPTSNTRCICPTCSGTAKVMCTSCLCTGMALATEHDPRIDPFD